MSKLVIAIGIVVVGLVVLFGLYLFLKGARNVQLALASTKWPKTSGIVVGSDTTRSVTSNRRTNQSSATFSTKTVIQYAVNGQNYTTDVLHFGQTLGSGDKSAAALQRLRYPVGKKVVVSYNPRNPAIGVMKPGLHAEAFWLAGAGLAFLVPAAMIVIMGPTMVGDFTAGDRTFARHETPAESAIPRPRRAGDDVAMAGVAAIFGAVVCGLGVLALTAGLQRMWHGFASQGWPTTPGTVIFAAAGDETSGSGDMYDYSRFVYQYDVAGIRHFNNVRQFAQIEGGSTEDADRIAARYTKGAGVTVSYFPTDPDVAVLEPGNTNAALWLPGIGVVALLFGLAVFIWIVPAVAGP
ncbi:MAG: DUF3592 domain-containing protein [Bryobacteraceae bacterium]|jgi:hypothetical protein